MAGSGHGAHGENDDEQRRNDDQSEQHNRRCEEEVRCRWLEMRTRRPDGGVTGRCRRELLELAGVAAGETL